MMTKEEKEKFLFEQTCAIIAGRVANSALKNTPEEYIEKRFKSIYQALAKEIEQSYISTSVKK